MKFVPCSAQAGWAKCISPTTPDAWSRARGERYVSPAELAVLYAALGEREQAFKSLEKGFAARDLQLQFLGIDPAFDSLRDDPRFADLMRRVGLPSVAKPAGTPQ